MKKSFSIKTILGNFVFYNEENKSKEIQGKNVLSFTKFVLGIFVRGGLAWGFFVGGGLLGGFGLEGFCPGFFVGGFMSGGFMSGGFLSCHHAEVT